MHEERTNLYRVVAQNLQWIEGITGIHYGIKTVRVIRTEDNNGIHNTFDVLTNSIRPARTKHPMGLVVEQVHVAMNGPLAEVPDWSSNDDGIVYLDIDDMFALFLKTDNGGSSVVSVQTKFNTFDGGEDSLSRQFIYKNNMLFQIR